VSGLDKILAPLVLVHLQYFRDEEIEITEEKIEKTTAQIYIEFSNLVLSVSQNGSEAVP